MHLPIARLPTLLAPLALALAFPAGAAAPGYRVGEPEAELADGAFKIKAVATLPLPCAKAWEVFTDFEAMPRFLPGLASSRIVSKAGSVLVVEQSGTARYGIFSRSYRSQREVRLDPPSRVSSSSLKSADPDQPEISSQTVFEESGSGAAASCLARYTVEARPKGGIPAGLAASAARSVARANMEAMLRETARRHPQAEASLASGPQDTPAARSAGAPP